MPQIVLDDDSGDATPTAYVGINPEIGSTLNFGSFGIVLRPGDGSAWRGILVQRNDAGGVEGPLWQVSGVAWRMFSGAIPYGGVGGLAFLYNDTGGTIGGGLTANGNKLYSSSTANNKGNAQPGTWRASGPFPPAPPAFSFVSNKGADMPHQRLPVSEGWALTSSYQASEDITIRVGNGSAVDVYWLTGTDNNAPAFEDGATASPWQGNPLSRLSNEIIPLRAGERVWFAAPQNRTETFLILSY